MQHDFNPNPDGWHDCNFYRDTFECPLYAKNNDAGYGRCVQYFLEGANSRRVWRFNLNVTVKGVC